MAMRSLHKGSRIGIISPATTVREEYIDGAVRMLASRGYEGIVMPHAKGPADGSYASSARNRLDDFMAAWCDPDIDAVLCARGGYGAAHLLPELPPETIRQNAKWLIGFSDISAFHAYLTSLGIESLHAPMAKHLCENPDNRATHALFHILEGGRMEYILDVAEEHLGVTPGYAEGRLLGGNLAVLDGLAATPFDMLARPLTEDVILFIEDIAEPIYKVERMLWRLYLSGALSKVKGLIVGRFTDYKPSLNFNTMEEMIMSLTRRIGFTGIPVVYNFPVGHVDDNLPLVEGALVALSVTSGTVRLSQLK